jgi:hypothetical protein
MTNELLTLIVAHIACADMAVERQLSMGEVRACSAIYQEIKLAFVPDIDTRSYGRLSMAEQHAVNMAGYMAFHEWRVDNPGTLRHLERVARGETKLGEAS